MNLDLIKKHVKAAAKSIVNPAFNKDGSNASDFYVADVVGHKRFAQNYGGYPRSEIAEINAQTNIQVAKQLLSELSDFSGAVNNQNPGVPDAVISMSHKSKYLQEPAEMIDFIYGQLAIRDGIRAQQAVKAAAAKAAAAKADIKSDKEIVDEV